MASSFDFALQIGPEDVATLAAKLAHGGRIRVPGAFAPQTATALHDELANSSLWCRTFRQDKVERNLSADQLANLEPRYLAAFEKMAWAGPDDGFRFLYDAIHTSDDGALRLARGTLVDTLLDRLNTPDQLEILRSLAANDRINRLSLFATRYQPGHFLTVHDDGHGDNKRVVAVVLNLSPRWLADWGGLLQFHDDGGDIAGAFTPAFNTLHLFTVPQRHSVSVIAPFAPAPRLSLAGWLYCD